MYESEADSWGRFIFFFQEISDSRGRFFIDFSPSSYPVSKIVGIPLRIWHSFWGVCFLNFPCLCSASSGLLGQATSEATVRIPLCGWQPHRVPCEVLQHFLISSMALTHPTWAFTPFCSWDPYLGLKHNFKCPQSPEQGPVHSKSVMNLSLYQKRLLTL